MAPICSWTCHRIPRRAWDSNIRLAFENFGKFHNKTGLVVCVTSTPARSKIAPRVGNDKADSSESILSRIVLMA